MSGHVDLGLASATPQTRRVLRLTLIRHANADWKEGSFADFERPLNQRGSGEAEAIGRLLMENGLVPELLLVSTARRTQQTAEILSRVMGLAVDRVRHAEPLYLAGAQAILSLAQATAPEVGHLAIVGHNPGISELARSLAPDRTAIAELSTACACALMFREASWADITAGAIRAARYDPTARSAQLFT